MGVAVNLDKKLVSTAKSYSVVGHRSVPKQIEHWAKIGRIAEENQDLSYDAIKEILLGLSDAEVGNVDIYKEGEL